MPSPPLGLLSTRFVLIHVILPILIGALIYTLWRKPTLLVFSWYDALGMSGWVGAGRAAVQSLHRHLPHWFLFCLPDGLWVYAVTSFMGGLWIKSSAKHLFFWMSVGPVLAIGGEIGQWPGLVQGTYEGLDIAFYLMGFFGAVCSLVICNSRNHEKYSLPTNRSFFERSRAFLHSGGR